jgi:hypothetical protein
MVIPLVSRQVSGKDVGKRIVARGSDTDERRRAQAEITGTWTKAGEARIERLDPNLGAGSAVDESDQHADDVGSVP